MPEALKALTTLPWSALRVISANVATVEGAMPDIWVDWLWPLPWDVVKDYTPMHLAERPNYACLRPVETLPDGSVKCTGGCKRPPCTLAALLAWGHSLGPELGSVVVEVL